MAEEGTERAVETSIPAVRVNTDSDVGNKSVWGACSHASKHRNDKWHAMRLNTKGSLSAKGCGAKLLVQSCWPECSASAAVNEHWRERVSQTLSSLKCSHFPQRCNLMIFQRTQVCAYCPLLWFVGCIVFFCVFYFLLCFVFKYCFLSVEFMQK